MKIYESPVCRLIEVAPQMGICQVVSPYNPNTPILPPTEGHITPGSPV